MVLPVAVDPPRPAPRAWRRGRVNCARRTL